jgi:hypothetical protein
MRLMPILPAERDPRLITLRRRGTLTDEQNRLLAEWAAPYAPNTSCTFSTRSSRATPDRATPSMSVARGPRARCAWVTHDELLSRRMRPHTWQPTIWVLRRTRLGPWAPLRPPV